jgi:two-component system LytT family response regulator
MIQAVLVDDDLYALNRLQELLSTLANFKVEVMASFQDPMLAYTYLKQAKPDVIFLDVRMPGINGFELLDLVNTPAEVIFVTAYDAYAIQAIRYSAFDYLLKPLTAESLKEALQRLQNQRNKTNRTEQLSALQFNLNQNELSKFRIILPGLKDALSITAGHITHCVAESNYTHVYLSTGKHILASKTLGDVEQLLPSSAFMRIHKSYLINLHFLDGLKTEPAEVQLNIGIALPVSRRRLQEVKQALMRRKA